ncbi:MAG: LPS export ABC transporter periplasmic protein LptC [Elusimicrobia bacterium]|nr:LPS export ABC transporter periplasmic protein LptC [Elusimicrobiota bacterium]
MRYALAALLLAGSACGRSGEAEREERRQVMEGLTLSQSDRGEPSWTLKSSRAVLREDAKLATLTEPVMEFYKKGKAVSRVTALSGEVDTESHGVRLSSSVVLDSFDDRSRLTTTELFYDSARGRFTTTADILVKRPEGVLRGRGLEAKPDLSEIRIFNQSSTLSGRSR